MEKFACTEVKPWPKHHHTFGCPVYVLKTELQANQHLSKWSERAQVGIYVGHSQKHSRSMSLVLSLSTGLCSPQYHVKHDDLFETVKQHKLPASLWQSKCHFTKTKSPLQPPLQEGVSTMRIPPAPPNEGAPSDDNGPPNEGGEPASLFLHDVT